jgi:hypothetical protein
LIGCLLITAIKQFASMKMGQMLNHGLAGTVAMTAFSCLSANEREFVSMPLLLGCLLKDFLPSGHQAAGWAVHFTLGVAWSPVFYAFYNAYPPKFSLAGGVKLGLLGGLVGMGLWSLLFRFHPNPPRIHKASFMRHLLIAHLIYGQTLALTA